MKIQWTTKMSLNNSDPSIPKTKIVWATDIHLNWAAESTLVAFMDSIAEQKPDALLLSGDISDGNTTKSYVEMLSKYLGCKIYFVLGNHDFYHKYIEEVYQWCHKLARKNKQIVYLPSASVVNLGNDTALVGVNGWGDCLAGNFRDSTAILSDHKYIYDLRTLNRKDYGAKLTELGQEDAIILHDSLSRALEQYSAVLVLTHVPPFRESAIYKGLPSDDIWAPFFVCKSVGDVLLELASKYPTKMINVQCGHSHGEGVFKPLPNLIVHTAGAVYRRPKIAEVFEV